MLRADIFSLRTILTLSFVTLSTSLLAVSPAEAKAIDPKGDFLSTYIGTGGADLDVVSIDFQYNPSKGVFVFLAKMAGLIGTSPGATYVWGIDRGAGTERFVTGTPSVGQGVKFDSVLALRPNGTGSFTDLAFGGTTVIDPANIRIRGRRVSAVLPGALLKSAGFDPEHYTANLWPRDGGGNARITDFAPDASNLGVTVVPEPSTALIALSGLVGFGILKSLRRSRATT